MEAPGASDVNASPALTIRLQDGQLQLIEPLDVLKDCAIFIIFPESRSENLPIAISLAQSTTVYGEQKVGGRTMHWAGITSTLEDLKRGAELLRLAGSWKGTMTQINDSYWFHSTGLLARFRPRTFLSSIFQAVEKVFQFRR